MDDATDAFAFVHQVKGLVDIFQAHGVGDESIQRDFTGFSHFDVAWQLGTTTHPTESRPAPDSTGHQLEWTGGDFLACTGDADDHRLAPALVAALKRGAHQLHVADAFEGKVDASIGHVDDDFLDRTVKVFRIDAVGGAQLLGDFKFGRVDIDGNDPAGLGFDRTDDRRQTDPAEAEDSDGIACFTLAVLSTAPMPVVTPQPSRQTFSRGASLAILATEISGSTVYSEKVEVPM